MSGWMVGMSWWRSFTTLPNSFILRDIALIPICMMDYWRDRIKNIIKKIDDGKSSSYNWYFRKECSTLIEKIMTRDIRRERENTIGVFLMTTYSRWSISNHSLSTPNAFSPSPDDIFVRLIRPQSYVDFHHVHRRTSQSSKAFGWSAGCNLLTLSMENVGTTLQVRFRCEWEDPESMSDEP